MMEQHTVLASVVTCDVINADVLQEYCQQLGLPPEVTIAAIAAALSQACKTLPEAAAASGEFDALRATVRDIQSVENQLTSQFQHLPVIEDDDADEDDDEEEEEESGEEEEEDEQQSEGESATGSPPAGPTSSSVSTAEHSREAEPSCTAADQLPLDSLDLLDPA